MTRHILSNIKTEKTLDNTQKVLQTGRVSRRSAQKNMVMQIREMYSRAKEEEHLIASVAPSRAEQALSRSVYSRVNVAQSRCSAV